jgi:hypothetical protein
MPPESMGDGKGNCESSKSVWEPFKFASIMSASDDKKESGRESPENNGNHIAAASENVAAGGELTPLLRLVHTIDRDLPIDQYVQRYIDLARKGRENLSRQAYENLEPYGKFELKMADTMQRLQSSNDPGAAASLHRLCAIAERTGNGIHENGNLGENVAGMTALQALCDKSNPHYEHRVIDKFVPLGFPSRDYGVAKDPREQYKEQLAQRFGVPNGNSSQSIAAVAQQGGRHFYEQLSSIRDPGAPQGVDVIRRDRDTAFGLPGYETNNPDMVQTAIGSMPLDKYVGKLIQEADDLRKGDINLLSRSERAKLQVAVTLKLLQAKSDQRPVMRQLCDLYEEKLGGESVRYAGTLDANARFQAISQKCEEVTYSSGRINLAVTEAPSSPGNSRLRGAVAFVRSAIHSPSGANGTELRKYLESHGASSAEQEKIGEFLRRPPEEPKRMEVYRGPGGLLRRPNVSQEQTLGGEIMKLAEIPKE